MANIFLRSPHFISKVGTTGWNSVKVNIEIGGIDVYTLIKNKVDEAEPVLFEVAELIRDYLNIEIDSTIDPASHSVVVTIDTTVYEGLKATGTVQSTVSADFFGIDAYGYFEEGSNPTTTKGYMQTNTTIYKLGNDDLILPIDRNNASAIAYYYAGMLVDSAVITSSVTEAFIYLGEINDVDEVIITGTDGSVTLTVINLDECMFEPHKISFVNRLGGIQDLYFFKKSIETLNTKRETYKNSTITNAGTYDSLIHARKDFNVKSTKEITLNSGYVSEDYNAPMQELMQSEQVWMTVNNVITPMNVKDSSFVFKTSLNDKMVDYKLQLKYAFDAINNIR
jgi:hypothetical protein